MGGEPLPEPGTGLTIQGLSGGDVRTGLVGVDGDILQIDPPRLGGELVSVPTGRTLRLVFRRDGVPCLVPVRVERGGDGGEAPILARVLGPPVRNQRRAHYRVEDTLEVRVMVDGDAAAGLAGGLSGLTVNISEGGVLVRVGEALPPGTEVTVHLGLPEGLLRLRGRVVRIERSRRARGAALGIAFRIDGEVGPDALRKHILARQRTLRRRELGLADGASAGATGARPSSGGRRMAGRRSRSGGRWFR